MKYNHHYYLFEMQVFIKEHLFQPLAKKDETC
jgi:hypothetical protein